MTTKQFLYTTVCLLAMSACKTPSELADIKTPKLPVQYESVSTSDTISSAKVSWRKFVTDTTLAGLIETGLKNNFDALIAYQRLEMAQSDIRGAKGALLPSVSITAEAAQRKWGLYTMDGAGNASTYIREDEIVPEHLPDYFLGFRASWEVDIWGKLKSKKAGALARYLASVEGRNYVYTNIIAEITTAYFELVALDNELEIIQNTIQLQEQALKMVTIQKESGAANDLAVRQIEAQVLNSQGLALQVKQDIVATENRLNLLLGRVAEPIQRNSDFFDSALPPQIDAGVPAGLLVNRPDVRQAEYQLRAARADVKSARAAFLPNLTINGTLGFQSYKPSLLFLTPESMAYTLVGNLLAPVVNRSALKANFAYANAAQLEALYQYQRTVLTGYAEVSTQYSQLETIKAQTELKTREVEVLDRSVEISDDLFRTGRATYVEVILAQSNALIAKRDLVQLKKLKHITSIQLYKALGGGVN